MANDEPSSDGGGGISSEPTEHPQQAAQQPTNLETERTSRDSSGETPSAVASAGNDRNHEEALQIAFDDDPKIVAFGESFIRPAANENDPDVCLDNGCIPGSLEALIASEVEQDDNKFLRDLNGVDVDEFTRLWWFPFPKKGQRVFYPKKWRVIDETGRENPFTYWGAGLWWLSWILLGADRDTLAFPGDYEQVLASRFGWELPPMGLYRKWRIGDMKSFALRPELSSHINMLTLPHKLGIGRLVLGQLRQHSIFLFLLVLSLSTILLPSTFVVLFYGVIPIGDVGVCDFSEFAVWLFLTNPVTEIAYAFVDISLTFASLDSSLPWRPFAMYLPVLIVIYIVQVLFYLPIVLTVGTFALQALVSRFMTSLIVIGYYFHVKKAIFAYDKEHVEGFSRTRQSLANVSNAFATAKTYECTEEENYLFQQAVKVSAIRSTMLYSYSGYMIGLKLASSNVQTVLGIVIMFVNVAYRKFVQHFAVRFHRDANFLLSGLSVYSMNASFIVFSTPNINMDDGAYTDSYHTYIALFLSPLSDVFVAFFHQSNMWFRFRNWVKKIPRPILCCARTTDYAALGVEVDMDFDGRGITCAHPDYRRTKTYFDFTVFWGSTASYACYMFTSWIFMIGPNKDNYPFNNLTGQPELSFFSNRGFTWEDYGWSMAYAGIVVTVLFLGFVCYVYYMRAYYPDIWPSTIANMYTYGLHPYKLGLAIMVITTTLGDTIVILLNFSRVWYVDVYATDGNCAR